MKANYQKKIGVILQYLQMALGTIISLIYTPIMLRILGQTQYGIYNLANSIISYLSLLSLGFNASYIRFYSRYKQDNNKVKINRLNGLFAIVFLIIGLVSLIFGLLLSQNVSVFFNSSYSANDISTAKILMIFMSFNLSLSFFTSVFSSYVTSQERFIFQKLLNMLKTVAGPFLTIPILMLGYGSIGMVIVTTIVTIIVDVINIYYCLKKLNMKFDFNHPDKLLLKEITIYSSFIALNQIVDQINWATDKVILGKVCGGTAVAIYSIGSQINTYYLQFSSAISGVFIPQVHRIVAKNKDKKDLNCKLTSLFIKVGRYQFIIVMLVLTGFLFFGKYFIYKWAGAGYEKSYYIALLLIVPATIPLIQSLGMEIQRAKNMHQFRSYTYLFMAILNVVISYFLAKQWGEIGAAFGTTLSLLIANGLIMNIYYHKFIGLDIIKFWKEIFSFVPALICPLIAGIVLNMIGISSMLCFIVHVLIYIIIYLFSFYLFGFNKDEKNQLNRIFYKLNIVKKYKGDN